MQKKTVARGAASTLWAELGVPQYAPARPRDMYPDEWTTWADFLGTRRAYGDARALARTLGVRSELRWYACVFALLLIP